MTYLERGFKENGYECNTIFANNHIFQYVKEKRFFVKILQKISSKACGENVFKRQFFLVLKDLYMMCLMLYICCLYDVFIFTYGTTFLRRNYDLPILKFFNKKIIMLYLGSDSRPPYLAGNRRNLSTEEIMKLTKKMAKAIKFSEKYADYIINYPPQALFQEKKYILGLIVGLPIINEVNEDEVNEDEVNEDEVNEDEVNEDEVIILHSPSSPIDKGTLEIREIITEIRSQGYRIKYKELINRPHFEILKNLQTCDFVIDQMFSDTPMAVFALEAAFYGKPAVVGGYYNDFILQDVPVEIPQSEYVNPEDMKQAIIKLIENKKYRVELGKRAQKYVKEYLSPKIVAKRYLNIINGEIPQSWIYNPLQNEYFYGYGYTEAQVKERIREVVSIGGYESLYLPAIIEEKIKRFLKM